MANGSKTLEQLSEWTLIYSVMRAAAKIQVVKKNVEQRLKVNPIKHTGFVAANDLEQLSLTQIVVEPLIEDFRS